VLVFNIVQFFPSINHEFLLAVLCKLGFHPQVVSFLESYLVQRHTSYMWNYTSEPLQTNVDVGQGSALSPVLSTLVIAPIMMLYRLREQGLDTTLITYVDDGLFTAQSPDIPQNCVMLRHAYMSMHEIFTAAGLVMEHDNNKLFHFTRARTGWDRPINLGFAPFMDETPLKPNRFWHYLGFFFDRKLTFQEHVQYYTTKSYTTVVVMRMLGNSAWGLSPKNKWILYHACVLPIATYVLDHRGVSHVPNWRSRVPGRPLLLDAIGV
jgi:hypothetical protein